MGDLLNVSYEYRVLNYTKADKGATLYFPSVTTVFPLLPSGTHQVFSAPRTSVIAGSKWSDAKSLAVSSKVGATLTFNPNASAYLSTAKIAVMATTPTGSLTLEVRWHWTVFHVKNGHRTTGAWSTPTSTARAPYLPSIFFPASYVGIVSTSGSPVATNTTYVVGLNGTVAGTWFRMVFEYPNNGTEIQSIYEYTTANITLFNATVPVAFTNGTGVPSGNYLIHVHDSCQAIVHVLKVAVS